VRKRIGIYVLLSSTGIILLLLGLFFRKTYANWYPDCNRNNCTGTFSSEGRSPLLARKKVDEESSKIEWRDERNTVIREKAAWYTV
jgi:hypothetical protein